MSRFIMEDLIKIRDKAIAQKPPTIWEILDRMDSEIAQKPMTWEQATGANVIPFRRKKQRYGEYS